jgi:hypothetical protein
MTTGRINQVTTFCTRRISHPRGRFSRRHPPSQRRGRTTGFITEKVPRKRTIPKNQGMAPSSAPPRLSDADPQGAGIPRQATDQSRLHRHPLTQLRRGVPYQRGHGGRGGLVKQETAVDAHTTINDRSVTPSASLQVILVRYPDQRPWESTRVPPGPDASRHPETIPKQAQDHSSMTLEQSDPDHSESKRRRPIPKLQV